MNSAAPPGSPASPEADLRGEARDEGSTVGMARLVADLKKVVPSWVSVAQDKRSLRKYDVDVANKDGLLSVEIPDDVLTSSTPLWEDFVVGKFLDLSPHVAKVHMVLNKIWKYGDDSAKVEVFEVNATTMRFRLSNPRSREKILKRGMWNIVGVPMVVTKWTPRTEEEKQKEEAIPMWVHLQRVPLHMFSWEGLSFITSAVGSPVKLHPETLACSNFEVAKVFVNVDVSKPLSKEINFSKNGKEFKVDFHFPWLPTRCKLCNKWGHSEKVCVLKGKDKVHDSPPTVPMEEAKKGLETALSQNGNIGEVATPVAEDVETVVAEDVAEDVELDGINKEEVLAENMKTVVGEEELELNASKNGELVTKIGENEVLGETNKLLLVSSSKVGRSPVRFTQKNQTSDFQISGSKFSVLSNDEEEEGEITGDGLQNLAVAETLVNNDSVNAEEDNGVNTTSNHAEEKAKETHVKGATKEKKAKSQDANPLTMSTRSSRRYL